MLLAALQAPGGDDGGQRSCLLVRLALQIRLWGQLWATLKQEPTVPQECQVPHAQNHAIVLVSLVYFHSLSHFSQLLVLRGVSFISATKPACWLCAHQSWLDIDSFPKVLGTAVNIYGPGIRG